MDPTDADGPAAPSMIPRPRDFTQGFFKYKSTIRAEPPTDADLHRVVEQGLQASAMPSFRDLLSDAEIRAVVDEVKRLAGISASVSPVAIAPRMPPDDASIGRGRALYVRLECGGCHGPDGRKTGFMQDAKSHLVPVRDLTAPWTFRGGSSPDDF
jgi:mono/diheme cytochrome c family protein